MPPAALVAVLVAAVLHATWNLLVKASGDRLVTASAQVVLSGFAFLPVVVWRGFPTEAVWFILASGVVQTLYLYTLATAYSRADLSFVYPLARGTAPLIIAIGSLAGLSVQPGPMGWVALLLICGGVVGLAFASRSRHGLAASLLTGFLIAVYISIDGAGVTYTDDLLSYTAALYAVTTFLTIPMVVLARGWPSIRQAVATDWKSHLGGGLASVTSYGLLLFASRLAPLALVSAARETAVVFAAFGGWWLLGERMGRIRAAGVAVIALGMAVLALGR